MQSYCNPVRRSKFIKVRLLYINLWIVYLKVWKYLYKINGMYLRIMWTSHFFPKFNENIWWNFIWAFGFAGWHGSFENVLTSLQKSKLWLFKYLSNLVTFDIEQIDIKSSFDTIISSTSKGNDCKEFIVIASVAILTILFKVCC